MQLTAFNVYLMGFFYLETRMTRQVITLSQSFQGEKKQNKLKQPPSPFCLLSHVKCANTSLSVVSFCFIAFL